MLRIAVALGAFALGGCVPIPHMENSNLEINGSVTREGQPVAGAPVEICAKWGEANHCALGQITQTDERGQFHIQAERHLVILMPLLGDRLSRIGITVTVGGLSLRTVYATMGTPRLVTLLCVVTDELKCTGTDNDR